MSKQVVTKKRFGQLPHVPTDEGRKEVKLLSGFGVPQAAIAKHIGINVDTLAKYYRKELDGGVLEANKEIAGSLFKNAMGDDAKAVSAAIFWLKTRAGWRDVNQHEITGKDGGPIKTAHIDVSELTDEGLKVINAASKLIEKG